MYLSTLNHQNLRPKTVWVCAIWIVLQLSRLVAIPLISDVLTGKESIAWLYPAIVDVVVAVPSLFLAWAVLKKPSLLVWAILIAYFAVSITDHGGATTALFSTGTPQVFGGGDNPWKGWLMGPGLQTVIDMGMLFWLSSKTARQYFLGR